MKRRKILPRAEKGRNDSEAERRLKVMNRLPTRAEEEGRKDSEADSRSIQCRGEKRTTDQGGNEGSNPGFQQNGEGLTPGIPEGIPESVAVTDVLDLHGFFPEQAAEMTEAFIENAAALGLRHVRIIHGKGRSRLKWEVIQVLKDHPKVHFFHDAPFESGGWGATMVELKA